MFKNNNVKKHNNKQQSQLNQNAVNELKNEFSEDISYLDSENVYGNNGVYVERKNQSEITLTYNGLLAKNGANEIYSVIGFGENNNWQDVEYHKMVRTAKDTFKVVTPINNSGNFNIAFKDNADNWDNNSGSNYIFH